ncbi:hypothetical protein OU5_6010 [Pseudomonas mandelii JR-1]|uniref:Uncharacterized protein n=1 Tax=Pseudomonas mandelii JR-1 TaxID=1147786 RepID=A0A024EJF3_9PSED|nr:hypothetical protein OU5_6010 [Pseudomonas mandelii JR-1]
MNRGPLGSDRRQRNAHTGAQSKIDLLTATTHDAALLACCRPVMNRCLQRIGRRGTHPFPSWVTRKG